MLLYFLKHLRRRQSQNDLKEDIVCNQTIAGLLFCFVYVQLFCTYYGSQRGPTTVWLHIFFKMCSLMSHRRKKSNADLEQQVGE